MDEIDHRIVSLLQANARRSFQDIGQHVALTPPAGAVAGHPEVVSAFTVAGESAAILHVRARNTAHLETTLERLREAPGVIGTQSQVVLSTLLERPIFSLTER